MLYTYISIMFYIDIDRGIPHPILNDFYLYASDPYAFQNTHWNYENFPFYGQFCAKLKIESLLHGIFSIYIHIYM